MSETPPLPPAVRLLLVLVLALAGCAEPDAPAPTTIEGVDPVQADGDLAPNATLRSDGAALAPDAGVAPAPDLAPETTLQPDSSLAH